MTTRIGLILKQKEEEEDESYYQFLELTNFAIHVHRSKTRVRESSGFSRFLLIVVETCKKETESPIFTFSRRLISANQNCWICCTKLSKSSTISLKVQILLLGLSRPISNIE